MKRGLKITYTALILSGILVLAIGTYWRNSELKKAASFQSHLDVVLRAPENFVVGGWESRGSDIQDVVQGEQFVLPNMERESARIDLTGRLITAEGNAYQGRVVQLGGVMLLAFVGIHWKTTKSQARQSESAPVMGSPGE